MTGFTGWHRYPPGLHGRIYEEEFRYGRPVRLMVPKGERDLTIRRVTLPPKPN